MIQLQKIPMCNRSEIVDRGIAEEIRWQIKEAIRFNLHSNIEFKTYFPDILWGKISLLN